MLFRELLDSAGVEYRIHGEETRLCCPFCEGRGKTADTRFLLGINERRCLAGCFHCQWACSGLRDIAQELCRVYGLKYNLRKLLSSGELFSKEKLEPPKPIGLPEEYEHFGRKPDEIERCALDYLRMRGVSRFQILMHGIGYAAYGRMSWRIIFPVLDERGAVVACVGRDFTGQQKPKYLNSAGSKLFWNGHREAATAVVCEGIMDALRVEKLLYDTLPGAVALARLGTAANELQYAQLRKYKSVIVLPDWDRAGVKGAINFCEKCEDAELPLKVAIPVRMTGADPASLVSAEVIKQLTSARPWSNLTKAKLRAVASRWT